MVHGQEEQWGLSVGGVGRESRGGVVRNSWWVERAWSSMTGERRSKPCFELGR